MDITLTDGGTETRIIYEFKRPIGDFEAHQLLADEAGRDILQRITRVMLKQQFDMVCRSSWDAYLARQP